MTAAFPPLALVSEIQRSGGSLLSQLFDGHPQIFAHPFEINIGRPLKWNWPDLDPAAGPRQWLEQLYEHHVDVYREEGYAKPGSNPFAAEDKRAFDFDSDLLRRTFLARLAGVGAPTQRQAIDAYFAAFFTAWRGWKASGRERWVSGFIPRLIMLPDSMARLERDYPDGRIVSLVRDPRSWRVSTKRHNPEHYADLAVSMRRWRTSAAASVNHARRSPDRVLVTTYERLVGDNAATMRRIAAFLEIEFLPALTVPTYLGRPLRPNSSFPVAGYGLSSHGLDRSADLAPDERTMIEREMMPLYAEVEREIERAMAAT